MRLPYRFVSLIGVLALVASPIAPPTFAAPITERSGGARADVPAKAIVETIVSERDPNYGYHPSTVKNAPVQTASVPTSINVISGVKNIPGDYATLALAITDMNAQGVGAGGVTLNLLAGNPQTAPAGGYVIGGAGSLVLTTASAANPITIQGNGNTITAFTPQTVGSINDAVFKLIGADFTTITGFTMQENAGNAAIATAAANNATEFGIALFYVTATDGAQNNTIQGNTISLNRSYRNTFAIYSNVRHTATSMTVTADATSPSGANSNNKVYGNAINNTNYCIAFIGVAAAANMDTGNDIGGGSAATGNNLTNWGSNTTATPAAISSYVSMTGNQFAIFVNQQINENVSFNTITSAVGYSIGATTGGVFKNYSAGQPSGAFSSTINNNTITIANATTTATANTAIGIINQGLTPLNASATINLNNNIISATQGGTVATTAGATAISNSSLAGTMNINGNTVTAIETAPTATTAIVAGISNSGAAGTLNVNNNTLKGFASTAASGQCQGIVNSGAVTTAINMNGNQFGIVGQNYFTSSVASSGALFGATSQGGATTCAVSISNNDIRGITYNVAATASPNLFTISSVNASQTISNNTFTNLSLNTTGNIFLTANSSSLTATGTKACSNNSIVGSLTRTGASGTLFFYSDAGSSVTGSTATMTGNNFSNVTVSGASIIGGWNIQDGASATSGPVNTFTGNTFSNIVGGTGNITVVNVDFAGNVTNNLSNNSISNVSGAGLVIGLNWNTSNNGASIAQNTISALSTSSATAAVLGIAVVSGGTITVSKNKICDISNSTNASLLGQVNGMVLSGGTTVTASNNLIGNLTAPASTSPDAIRGIAITSTTAATTYRVYDNTVHFAASGGTTFGSSGLYHTASATATTGALDARGNIISNQSTPAGAGLTVAFRRSGTALNNLAATTNRNLWYAGSPGASNLIYNDGTNSDQTLAAYKARVATADANAVTENPPFASTTCGDPNFLHINPSIGTQIEGGNAPIAGVTDDYDGNARNPSTPDIGADEGNFTPPSVTINATATAGGTISPSGSVSVPYGGNQTFTITPGACAVIADVVVDGGSVGAVASYTFTNVTTGHTIVASFAAAGPYTITASAGAGGSISPNGATSVPCGGSQAYSIAGDACHTIADVLVDGVSVGAVASYTFSNVTANHTIDASFSLISYTITASAGANGSIAPNGATAVGCGGSQAYSITPNAGYVIADVLVDGGSIGTVASYTFSNVQANHTISASFAVDQATISVGSTATYLCPTNTCITLPVTISRSSATPVLAFSVTFQLGGGLTLCNGTASVTEGTFLSSSGGTIYNVADNGGGSYTADGAVFGGSCGPTATSGLLFSIGVASAAPGGTGTVTLTDVKLRDCANADLAVVAGPPGTVPIDNQAPSVTVTSPNGGETWFIGSSQTITWTATDNTGVANVDLAYSTDGGATYPNAIATGIANSGSYAWTVPNDATTQARVRVTAHDVVCSSGSDASDADVTIRNPIITASAGAGGSISPSGAVSVTYGGSQAFTIAADPCYTIADVLVDGVSVGAVSSYTFSNVTADHTIAASFVVSTYTITASAGAGGSIAPAGATVVNCGGSQAYTIATDACHTIADVLVDGVSVGAVSSYTFTNVQANHTIAASFSAITYTITATAGSGGSISPSGAVTVNCGDSQAFAITADAGYHIFDVLVDGSSIGAAASYAFSNVTANHTIAASFQLDAYTITATAGANGSISPNGTVLVSPGASQTFSISAAACYQIADVLVDGVSVGAVASYTFTNVQANHTIAASFSPTVASVSPVTGLGAAQLRTGNDASGTTKATITFTAPGGTTVEVWRKGFGGYPQYDGAGGAVPTSPGSYPPAGWTLTGVTTSGQSDQAPSRDYWYYVAYAKDACGNVSPVSAMTSGTLGYHLGDVTDGFTPGQGNNTVNTADLSLLGAHYGQVGGAFAGFEYLDVGPTTNNHFDGRPTTDSRLDFEDLVLFAINYTPVASALAAKPAPQAAAAYDAVGIGTRAAVTAGEEFDVPVALSGAGDLQALSVTLKWNSAMVEPLSAETGDLVTALGGIMLSPSAGTVDAAVLGSGTAFTGDGTIATVRFRAIASGDPGLGVQSVIGRDAQNAPVSVTIAQPLAVPTRVTATELQPVVPNPARGNAALQYSLAAPGPVDLSIYSVDGRRVTTVVRGTFEAGRYTATWNGRGESGDRVAAGVYYVRLRTAGREYSRTIIRVE